VSGVSSRLYFERSFLYLGFSDLIPATLKTIVLGFLIAVVASYLGFTTSRGTEGVGEASTRCRRRRQPEQRGVGWSRSRGVLGEAHASVNRLESGRARTFVMS